MLTYLFDALMDYYFDSNYFLQSHALTSCLDLHDLFMDTGTVQVNSLTIQLKRREGLQVSSKLLRTVE